LDHEQKFKDFIAWAEFPKESTTPSDGDGSIMEEHSPSYAVQFVRQINYGALEGKRYFIPVEGKDEAYLEITENDLVQANYKKLNS
jgi:hypothetical protein